MRNLITLRKYFIWSSNWFCDYHYYRILFNDLKINNYLKSVFYRLKLPTSQFIITRNYNKMYIEFTFFLKSFLKNINDYNHMLFFMKRNKYLLLSNGTLSVNSYFIYKKICHLLLVHFFYDNERYKKNIESQLEFNGSEHSSQMISFNNQSYLVNPFFNKVDWFINYISQLKFNNHIKTKENKTNGLFSFTNLLNLNQMKLNNLFSKSKLFYSYFYKKIHSIYKLLHLQKKTHFRKIRYYNINLITKKQFFLNRLLNNPKFSHTLNKYNFNINIKHQDSILRTVYPYFYKRIRRFNPSILHTKFINNILKNKFNKWSVLFNNKYLYKSKIKIFLKLKKKNFKFIKSLQKFSSHMKNKKHMKRKQKRKPYIESIETIEIPEKVIKLSFFDLFHSVNLFNKSKLFNKKITLRNKLYFYKKVISNKYRLKEKTFPFLKNISKKKLHFKSNSNISFFNLRLLLKYIKINYILSIRRKIHLTLSSASKYIPKPIANPLNLPYLKKRASIRSKKLNNIVYRMSSLFNSITLKGLNKIFSNTKKQDGHFELPSLNNSYSLVNSINLNVENNKYFRYQFNVKFPNDLKLKTKLKKKKKKHYEHRIKVFNSYINYINENKQCSFLGLFYSYNETYLLFNKVFFLINSKWNTFFIMNRKKNSIYYSIKNYYFLHNKFIYTVNRWCFFTNKFNTLFYKSLYLNLFFKIDTKLMYLHLCNKNYKWNLNKKWKKQFLFFFRRISGYCEPSFFKQLYKNYLSLEKDKSINNSPSLKKSLWKYIGKKSYNASDTFFSQFRIFYNYYLISHKIYCTFRHFFCKQYNLLNINNNTMIKVDLLLKKKVSYSYNTNNDSFLLYSLNSKLKVISSFHLFSFLLHNLIYFFEKKINLVNKLPGDSSILNKSNRYYSTSSMSPICLQSRVFYLYSLRTYSTFFYFRLYKFPKTYYVYKYKIFDTHLCDIKDSLFFLERYSKYTNRYFYVLNKRYYSILYYYWKNYRIKKKLNTLYRGWEPRLMEKEIIYLSRKIRFKRSLSINFFQMLQILRSSYAKYKTLIRSTNKSFSSHKEINNKFNLNFFYLLKFFFKNSKLKSFFFKKLLTNKYKYKSLFISNNIKYKYHNFLIDCWLDSKFNSKKSKKHTIIKQKNHVLNKYHLSIDKKSDLVLDVFFKGLKKHRRSINWKQKIADKISLQRCYSTKFIISRTFNLYNFIQNRSSLNKNHFLKLNSNFYYKETVKKRWRTYKKYTQNDKILWKQYKDFFEQHEKWFLNSFFNKIKKQATFIKAKFEDIVYMSKLSRFHIPIESSFYVNTPYYYNSSHFIWFDRFLNKFDYKWNRNSPYQKPLLSRSSKDRYNSTLFEHSNILSNFKKSITYKLWLEKNTNSGGSSLIHYTSNNSIHLKLNTFFSISWILNIFSLQDISFNNYYKVKSFNLNLLKKSFFLSKMFNRSIFCISFFNIKNCNLLLKYINILFIYYINIFKIKRFLLNNNVFDFFKLNSESFMYNLFSFSFFYKKTLLYKKMNLFNKNISFFYKHKNLLFTFYKYRLLGNNHIKYIFNNNYKYVPINFKIYSCKSIYNWDTFFIKYFFINYLYKKNACFNFLSNSIDNFFSTKEINNISLFNKSINHKTKHSYTVSELNTASLKRKKHVFTSFFYNLSNTSNFIFYNTILKNNSLLSSYSLKNYGFFILLTSYFTTSVSFISTFYYHKHVLFFYWFHKKIISHLWQQLSFLIKYFFILFLNKIYLFFSTLNIGNDLSFSTSHFSLLYSMNNFISKYKYHYNLALNLFTIYTKKYYMINYLEDYSLFSFFKDKNYTLICRHIYLFKYWYFFSLLESTINHYSNTNCFLLINYNFNSKYVINSAKMWCDKILFYLKKRMHIRKVFYHIRKQQIYEMERKTDTYFINRSIHNTLVNYKYPLQGIRILYSGNLKKAKRKQKVRYHLWVSDAKFYGPLSTNTLKRYIDYYHHSVALKNATVGIKLWLLFYLD